MTTIELPQLDAEEIARAIDWPVREWWHQCHAVSLAIVKSDILPRLGHPRRRVARGTVRGVMGQHSWIVLGDDPYDHETPIADPTLWSYRDDVPQGIWVGTRATYGHTPHGGHSNVWDYGPPPEASAPEVELDPAVARGLSREAMAFLAACGPMDHRGWAYLAEAPVSGWPAAEIIAAMDDTPGLATLVPIDRLGMLTDRNPSSLYLPTDSGAPTGATGTE